MRTTIFTLLVSAYCSEALNFKSLDEDVGPVAYVNILFRHGERTIIDPYPTDPNKDPKLWPLGWGQLTKAGIHHHYVLGNWLGERYAHLLPTNRNYNRKALRVQSTDVDRTLMSAESNLAGMFPMTPEERWGDLNWQPVPIHTVPEPLDKLLAMKYPCKRYDYALHKFEKSPEYKNILKNLNELGNYLQKNSGMEFTDLTIFDYLYSTLLIEKLNNYTLPEWTNSVFPEKMVVPAGLNFAKATWTPEMKRLKGGPLVKEMLSNMQKKVKGVLSEAGQNVTVFSAHDTTVANFLNTIGVFNMLPPPFASLVLVELRKTPKDEHVVMVHFKNTTDPDGVPYTLAIPGCTEACPIAQFETLLQPIIPLDWDSECHQHEFFDLTDDQPYNTLAIFAVVTSTLIVFLVLALTSVYWTKQKPNHIYHKLNVDSL
uniref:acid phosphatase n=1 Tax=Lygus hesperus TaxID=30085 RepID=A0A146M4M1_LYGHE